VSLHRPTATCRRVFEILKQL